MDSSVQCQTRSSSWQDAASPQGKVFCRMTPFCSTGLRFGALPRECLCLQGAEERDSRNTLPGAAWGMLPESAHVLLLINESLDFCHHRLLLINPPPPAPAASFPSLGWVVQPDTRGTRRDLRAGLSFPPTSAALWGN